MNTRPSVSTNCATSRAISFASVHLVDRETGAPCRLPPIGRSSSAGHHAAAGECHRFLARICARLDLHQSHPGHLFQQLYARSLLDIGFGRPVRFSCRLVRAFLVGSDERRMPTKHVAFRLGGRALQIYAVQILIAMLAIAMLAAAAMVLANPLLLEWNNAASVFYDPVPTHVGLVLITHQLGYFDILPLYVVLMLMAPFIAVVHRAAPSWLLVLSAAVYCVTLAIPIRMPTWPVDGQWFFNPLAWQFIFVLGFVLAKDDGLGAFVRRHIVPIRAVGLLILVGLFLVQWNDWWHDPTRMPQPRLFFILDKSYITPIRLVQFLSLVAVFSITFPTSTRRFPGWSTSCACSDAIHWRCSVSAPCSALPPRSSASCTAAISPSMFLW